MILSQALDAVLNFSPKEFSALSDLLSSELIDEYLANTGVVTVHKRRLPMEMMIWALTGMALFRSFSMNQFVSHLDIVLPDKRPFVAPSVVVQALSGTGLRPSAWFLKRDPPALVRKKTSVALEQPHADGDGRDAVENA